MQTIEIFATPSLPTLATLDLTTVTGGFSTAEAVAAGNAAAGPWREAGQTLGSGYDAAYKVVTGQDSTVGSAVGGPLAGAVGWAGGFASNSYQQLTGKK
jgi:hypothetical protein